MENSTTQNNTNNKDKFETVLEKIENNELEAHSKTYFRLRLIALIGLVTSIFAISILLISFIFFSLRIGGQPILFGFHRHNIAIMLLVFSWKLLLLDLILIAILSWLLRAFRFGYKIPTLYLLLALSAVFLAMGFVLDRGTSLHDRILEKADHHELPFFGEIYEGLRPMSTSTQN